MISEALHGFAFRLIGPSMAAGPDGHFYVQRSDGSVATLLETKCCSLDSVVVDFGADDPLLRRLLQPLLTLPRMGRLASAAILNAAVRQMDSRDAFVNVGVWHGFSILSAMAGNDEKTCVGVDNFSQFGGPRDAFLRRFLSRRSPKHRFYNQDYEDFFAGGLDQPVGVYFYDGAHDYKHQYQGLLAAEPLYSENAVIIVDDINWRAPRDATLQFAEDSRLDWTLILDQQTASARHPTLWNGVLILQAGLTGAAPLRWPTANPLSTIPGGAEETDGSLSLVVVGERDVELLGELEEHEVVRVDEVSRVADAIDACSGSHVLIVDEGSQVSAVELQRAISDDQATAAR